MWILVIMTVMGAPSIHSTIDGFPTLAACEAEAARRRDMLRPALKYEGRHLLTACRQDR